MKFWNKCKDGGPESPVDAYFLCEIKGLFSIALLKFNKGKREEFHTHAFHALTWFLKGDLVEEEITDRLVYKKYKRSLLPKFTPKSNLHRVKANEDSWCFTIRGPWEDTWQEFNLESKIRTTFTHGRKVLSKLKD